MADAIMMVRDAIGLACISMEDNGVAIPQASKLQKVDISKGAFFTFTEITDNRKKDSKLRKP